MVALVRQAFPLRFNRKCSSLVLWNLLSILLYPPKSPPLSPTVPASVNARTLSFVLLMLFGFGSLGWLQWQSQSKQPKPIGVLEQVIPVKFGEWSSQDLPMEDQTIQVLKAHSFINRLYTRASGASVSLHAANWQNEETIAPAPHHPEVCYPGAGWKILERRMVNCPSDDGEFPMELMLFERNGQRVVTGHWFQTGGLRYAEGSQFQKERHRFWGTRAWPGTEKFLLQCSSATLSSGQEVLLEFTQALLVAMRESEPVEISMTGS